MRLADKAVIVAGAGGGMGTAIPALFAREGARVLLVARRAEPLQALAAHIRSAGGAAEVCAADLETREGAEAMAKAALAAFGRIDVLYNNLGDSAASGVAPHETDDATWDYLQRINLGAAFLCSRAVLPAMLRQRRGSIIHASAAERVRLRAHAGYAAAKAGLVEFCRRLARVYRDDGIRVNCICPGGIGNQVDVAFDLPPPGLTRGAHPADVAYAALYFASDESAWVTGQTLEVDGGRGLSSGDLVDPSGFPDPGRPRYCARCGTPLTEVARGGRLRPVCPQCGWVYYAKNALGAAVLVERDDQLLLVQRADAPYAGWWMLPAGFVEYGEDAAFTAVREAQEECGLDVRLAGVFGTYFGTDDPRNPAYLIVYRAWLEPPAQEATPGDDAAAAGWFGRDALPEQIAFEAQRAAIAEWAQGVRTGHQLQGRERAD